MSRALDPDTRRSLRDELRDARAAALADAEGFGAVLVAIERVGAVSTGQAKALGTYHQSLRELASASPLVAQLPIDDPKGHTDFDVLYNLVQTGRNDGVHQGAYARALADHAVQLALILEDALMANADKVRDFMVRDVATAHTSQPLSAVRQMMLMRSFSFVPIHFPGGGSWRVLSDRGIARYLRIDDKGERRRRLAQTVEDALGSDLVAEDAPTCTPDDAIAEILGRGNRINLVLDSNTPEWLVGVLTPFDLL
jgi:hypothetical protein